jgi:hypothetical protein
MFAAVYSRLPAESRMGFKSASIFRNVASAQGTSLAAPDVPLSAVSSMSSPDLLAPNVVAFYHAVHGIDLS